MGRRIRWIDHARYDRLTQMLEDREREVVLRLRALRQSLPEDWAEVRDTGEESLQRLSEDVDFALVENTSGTAGRIHDALERMDLGLDQECADCGRDIGRRRLRVLPFADRCLNCKRKEEAAGVGAAPPARV